MQDISMPVLPNHFYKEIRLPIEGLKQAIHKIQQNST